MKNFNDISALRSVLREVYEKCPCEQRQAVFAGFLEQQLELNCKRLRLTQPPLHLNETIVRIDLTRHNAGAMRQRIVGRLCQTPVCPSSAFHRMEPPGREPHGRAAHPGERAGANESNALQRRPDRRAFTLIELLVVIAIIAILIGLLFPAFRAVQDQARRTQAKNDLTQIVTAVNAYYTEYGKYPLVTADTIITTTSTPNNADLFYTLRAVASGLNAGDVANPRKIVFINPPDVKDPANPRSGIGTAATNLGRYFDPWGTPYLVEIDGNYDNQLANLYTANAGSTPNLQVGVIAWSLGKDQNGATAAASGDKKTGVYDDDVISWQ
jgi:prepilin-type N-terminal cleavage/methylation domain-containing protein